METINQNVSLKILNKISKMQNLKNNIYYILPYSKNKNNKL